MMLPYLNGLIVAVLASCFSVFISKRLVPQWEDRGDYGFQGKSWNKMLTVATGVSIVLTVIISLLGLSVFQAIAMGTLAYFLVASAATDFRTKLIPKELSNMGLAAGLIFALVGFFTGTYYSADMFMDQGFQLTQQLITFGGYMFAISLLFVTIMFVPIIGFGDIKMFWVAGLFLGSFINSYFMLIVFSVALFIMAAQMVVGMVKTKSWKSSNGLPALPAFMVAYIGVLLWSLI